MRVTRRPTRHLRQTFAFFHYVVVSLNGTHTAYINCLYLHGSLLCLVRDRHIARHLCITFTVVCICASFSLVMHTGCYVYYTVFDIFYFTQPPLSYLKLHTYGDGRFKDFVGIHNTL